MGFKYQGRTVKFGGQMILCEYCQSNDVVETDSRFDYTLSLFRVYFECLACNKSFAQEVPH